MMCHNLTKKCYPLLSNNIFDIEEIKITDKFLSLKRKTDINENTTGIAISGKGEPINLDGQNIFYEIRHEFYCHKSSSLTLSTNQNTNIEIIKDTKNTNFYHIILKHYSIYGCPTSFISPRTQKQFDNLSNFTNETHFMFEEGDYKIDIDISYYNYKKEQYKQSSQKANIKNTLAWSTNVIAYGKINSYKLFFQPSLSIKCPQGFFCDDEEDANIWLCSGTNCTSYSLLKNGFEARLAPIGGLNGGVEVNYKGNYNRSASITFECDRFLFDVSDKNNGQIRLPYGVKIFDRKISFSIGAASACPRSDLPDPSPIPSVHIPMPKNSSVAPTTPDSQPSYSTNSNFFVKNSTHFTTFNLEEISQPLFRGNIPILVNGELGVIYTEFSPWNEVECPKGWECLAGSASNIWGCWIADADDLNQIKRSPTSKLNGLQFPYCHPIGDRRICAHLSPLAPNELDRGVLFKFCGEYTIAAEMKIECDKSNSPPLFSLHDTSAIFHRSLTGPDVTYNLSSSLVCPQKFVPIPFPSPAPFPTPSFDPSVNVNYHFTSPIINQSSIDIDMASFSKSEQWTVLRENSTYELSFIVFNPSKQVSCPSDYKCTDFDVANAWKCTKMGECFPIGDSRYKLSFNLNDQNNLDKGISVVYGGGFAGFSFKVEMICDKSKKDKLLEFEDVNLQNSEELIISVSVLTSFVCPAFTDDSDDGIDNSKVSIGSMFILILLILMILYISGGCFLIYLKTGVIEMPNLEFWSEFFIDLKTAVLFLITCGNTESQKERRKYSGI